VAGSTTYAHIQHFSQDKSHIVPKVISDPDAVHVNRQLSATGTT